MARLNFKEIDTAIVTAHSIGDKSQLSDLYVEAGLNMIEIGEVKRGCFFLTQGYIFALEEGMNSAKDIYETLIKYGHEQ